MPVYNCISPTSSSFPFYPPSTPLAEAVSCGLINSALMGAQQDGGEVERGLEVAGLWRVAL